MYNNAVCIGALATLLGLQNAYLHFHATYSLIHVFIILLVKVHCILLYCTIIFEVSII